MEILQYWKVIKKRLWLVVLLAAVALASSLFYSQRQTPLYRTTTTLFLNPGSPSQVLPIYTSNSTESLATTYREYMRTRSFGELVSQALADGTTPEQVLAAIATEYVPNQFFKITATHPDAAQAQRLAATTAEQFINQNLARQRAQQEQIKEQQDSTRALERQRLRELQQNLQGELDYYAQLIQGQKDQIARLEAGPSSADADQQLLDLREKLIQTQSLRVEAMSSLAQTQAALVTGEQQVTVDTAVVVDEAPLPTQPLPNNMARNTLLAVAAAIAVGLALAFLLEYLDYTIKTPEELDALYGMAALGVTGDMADGRRKQDPVDDLITVAEPRSAVAEAFRALRTNIQFANPEGEMRSLLVTSAGPGEGKSMTAANLAVSIAQGGRRVIIVDCDLRKPRVHKLFKTPKTPGFTNLVVDHTPNLDSYLHPTQVDNLWVLPCGIQPPNPSELLGSPRAKAIMELLKEHADVVIYDSPPAATVTDAVILATRVDGVLQVVRAGGTRRDLVLQGKAALEKVGAHILGPILNRVKLSDLGYYSYYYYYGHYYYGDDDAPGAKPSRRRRRSGDHRTEPALPAEKTPPSPV